MPVPTDRNGIPHYRPYVSKLFVAERNSLSIPTKLVILDIMPTNGCLVSFSYNNSVSY